MNLEIAVVTSAVDVSGHETNIRVIQGTTVMTISLSQYSPWDMCKKRVFDVLFSLFAVIVTAIVTVPIAIAINLPTAVLFSTRRLVLGAVTSRLR